MRPQTTQTIYSALTTLTVTQGPYGESPDPPFELFAQWDTQLYFCEVTGAALSEGEVRDSSITAVAPICPG